MRHTFKIVLTVVVVALVSAACGQTSAGAGQEPKPKAIRVGYFPNVTHAQPLVGLPRGLFQAALGDVRIEARLFNAGPSIVEAVFAGGIDIGYMGPSPAINGFVQSRGQALRVVAGAASGGASLVVRIDSGITSPQDLARKRIASPQLGNTQDVSLRAYLAHHGLKPKDKGGSVNVLPMRNPNILSLFLRKELDGAWVPEPWVTRLLIEAQGRIFVDERDLWPEGKFAATVVVVRKKFLDAHPDLVRRWLQAHVEVTRWMNSNPKEARETVRNEIRRLTRVTLSDDLLEQSFSRVEFTYEPLTETINAMAERAYTLGFLRARPNLASFVDLGPLNGTLAELGLAQVR